MNKFIKSEAWIIVLMSTILLPLLSALDIAIDINDILAIAIPLIGYIFGITLIQYKARDIDVGKPFYTSRKWWTTVINLVVVIVNKLLGYTIDPVVLYPVITMILTLIVGESIVDVSNLKKEVTNDKSIDPL